jgi:hypothetical protein
LIAEQGRAERQATQAHRASVLDLSGNVAAATSSRTGLTIEATTREQAQATWLIHRAEHSSDRQGEPAAITSEKNRTPRHQPDDDLAK